MRIVSWIVQDDEYPEHGGVCVFASTREKARYLGAAELSVEYECCSARRHAQGDWLCIDVERCATSREHRQLGWRCEDESPCASCGLYANDMDQFAVCDDCGNCKECGHATGVLDDGDACPTIGIKP